ncbi:MAG: hypothetical protein FJZ01_10000 [Candidatus Sericytochromatia bacterium]|nr:hypothetical protein [Candidatus Tanganyikabacteria bacterium]
MNTKFQRLREEVLATFPNGGDPHALPLIEAGGLDARAREDLQVRFYHLWERLKHFRPDDLEAGEAHERDLLAEHLQRCLTALHS